MMWGVGFMFKFWDGSCRVRGVISDYCSSLGSWKGLAVYCRQDCVIRLIMGVAGAAAWCSFYTLNPKL